MREPASAPRGGRRVRLGGERVMGIAASLLGVFAIVETLRLRGSMLTGGPGMRFLPLLLGALVTILGAAVAARPSGLVLPAFDRGGRVRVWGTVLALVVYALAFERLGYVLATAAFLTIILLGYGERRWAVVAAVAVGATGLAYAVFATWLRVPLPPGVLGY